MPSQTHPTFAGALRPVALEDKYLAASGHHFLSGMQVLVRALLNQATRDAARGWRTGGFVSGYRGSPLGGFDKELWKCKDLLEPARIVFRPGVNEELAAGACAGTQQLGVMSQ
ncbi:hypothetical protein [Ramlibacter sp.]|uniref:hypothetical protein n=1 Tax=Ramlibacter sp. TaxID=1917967 RepID=UPI0017CAE224|nr:hypothetical protein [Ramlibacter sp.]MBA2674173.1 hypothetical protein [Ramlibacter sp.]